MTDFILEIPLRETVAELQRLFRMKPQADLHLNTAGHELIAWGDPIVTGDTILAQGRAASPGYIVNNIRGHYYFIYHDKDSGELIAGNSMFSLLPVYYHLMSDKIILCNNAPDLGKYLGLDKVSRRFILETVLFNYPLFNNSIISGIKLLPSNSGIRITGNSVSFFRHTEIADFFERNPISRKDAVKLLPGSFLESVEKYLPHERYAVSVTGGFDGRTLAAASLYHNRDFSVYAFGNETSKDVKIAEDISGKAGLRFEKILLEEEYLGQHSIECGREFMTGSSGTATFARAHYLYAAKRLSSDYKHIITGNFGSEILRAAHVAGVMFSANLFNLFNSDHPEEALSLIGKSREFRSLRKESFEAEWLSLKDEISLLPCFNKSYSGLTRNQRFYIFVFEEVFRKYFGAELANQFRFIKNRTPFLDIDFVRAILSTSLAGIHSEFFEHNPFRRYKGQMLYAHIIRKAYPPFGMIATDKGYRPADLLSLSGTGNIVKGYIRKERAKGRQSPDPNSVERAWVSNREQWMKVTVSEELFNTGAMKEATDLELLFRIISLSFIKDIAEKQVSCTDK